jgi:hypothetical protein
MLALSHCSLPLKISELSCLHSLREISISPMLSQIDTIQLCSTLVQVATLTQLTSLSLPDRAECPAALAQLSELRSLYIWPGDPAMQHVPHAVLPLGPWLSELRSISCLWSTAEHNLAFLQTAGQLRKAFFHVQPDYLDFVEEPSPGFWDWAAQHQPLQELHVDLDGSAEEVEGWGAWELAGSQLRVRRPGLAVAVRHYDSPCSESDEEWWVLAPTMAIRCGADVKCILSVQTWLYTLHLLLL